MLCQLLYLCNLILSDYLLLFVICFLISIIVINLIKITDAMMIPGMMAG